MNRLLPLLIVLVITGCQSNTAVQTTVQERLRTPGSVQEQTPATGSAPSLPDYPLTPSPMAHTQVNKTYPTPANVSIPKPQSFKDCELWPGLIGCSSYSTALTDRIVYYDKMQKRLISIDLSNGAGWQVLMEAPLQLSWSPNGEKLLLTSNTNLDLPSSFSNMIYSNQGGVVEQLNDIRDFTMATVDAVQEKWNEAEVIRSTSGEEAWIDHNIQTDEWWVNIRLGPNAEEKKFPIFGPGNYSSFYHLYAWLPDTPYLIFLRSAMGTQNNLMGLPLYLLDSRTGAIENLGMSSLIESRTTVLTNNQLITVDPRPFPENGFPNLVLYDWHTHQKFYPLPGPVFIEQLSVWPLDRPEWIAFSATVGDLSSEESLQFIPRSGIYLLNLQTGEVIPVANTGGSFQWVKWTNNGKVLLFGFLPDQPIQEGYGGLYAYRLADKMQWLVGYVPVEVLRSADSFLAPHYMPSTP